MQISWPKSTWPDLRSVKDRVQQAEASGAPKEIQEPRFCGVFCCPPVCYSHTKADIESDLLFCGGEGGLPLRARALPRLRFLPSFQLCKAKNQTLRGLFCFLSAREGFATPVRFLDSTN